MAIKNIYRGDTKKYKLTFTGQDITDWELWFTVKATENDSDYQALIQIKHVVGADPDDDAANGIAFITVPSTATEGISPRTSCYYDFQRVIPGVPPDVQTLEKGNVSILTDITISNQ